MMDPRRWLGLMVIMLVMTGTIRARALEPLLNLTQTSLEELMDIDVTTVTKKSESLQAVPAAVFVLTQEDIRRSGATTLPDLLRLVPGVQVARLNAHQWSVSIRGFHNASNNKLLVVMDGRILYDPLHAGVFWEDQQLPLRLIQRIEVIRGGGGALWGANAVNGIINIITASAQDTLGGSVTAGAGTEERGFAEGAYTWKLDPRRALRIAGLYQHRETGFSAGPAFDDWQAGVIRARWDADESARDHLTINAQLRGNRFNERTIGGTVQPASHNGGHLMAQWTRAWDLRTDLSVLAYYDNTQLFLDVFKEQRQTVNADVQFRFPAAEHHDWVAGLNIRRTMDAASSSGVLSLDPAERTDHLFAVFLQDDIALVPGDVHAILGTKVEHNAYTGFEFQPSARLAWRVDARHTVWGAVSRLVRVPSRLETDFRIVFPPLLLTGSALDAEQVMSYEAGYRAQLAEDVLVDGAVFVNAYDRLVTVETFSVANRLAGRTWGVEGTGTWRATPDWRLIAGYTFFMMDLDVAPGSAYGATAAIREASDPRHQASLRSQLNLRHDLEWDACLRYVDALTGLGVPSYITLDLRLGWRPARTWECSLVGQNFLGGRHREGPAGSTATEVETGVYAQVTWKF